MLVICAHDVVQEPVELPWEIADHDLEMVLARLIDQGYSFTTLDELRQAPERSVALTFDDGTSGAASWLLHRAPALGVRATYFVVVDWLDRPPPRSADHAYRALASWDKVAELRDAGHSIGSHSMSHRRLATLDDEQIRRELHGSKSRIEEVLDVEVRHFAAPFGHLNSKVISLAKDAAYSTVSSTVPGVNGQGERQSGLLKRVLLRSDLPDLGLIPIEELAG
jgi:peptidoglycan/xylan/chitin deacetylase (PgdA/CDA1 family)